MTFVAFKEKYMEESERREKEQQQKCRFSWSKSAYCFFEGVDHYTNWTGFFSYTVQLKSFLCHIFMIIHLFLSWAESLAQEAVVQMKGIVSGKMGFVKVGLSDKPYPQQLPKNIFKPFKGA